MRCLLELSHFLFTIVCHFLLELKWLASILVRMWFDLEISLLVPPKTAVKHILDKGLVLDLHKRLLIRFFYIQFWPFKVFLVSRLL
jgi:hypothetical protein